MASHADPAAPALVGKETVRSLHLWAPEQAAVLHWRCAEERGGGAFRLTGGGEGMFL